MKRFKRLGRTVAWVVALLCAAGFFVRPYRVSDISMNYALTDGDLVWVENVTAGIHVPSFFFLVDRHLWSREKGIRRGDVLAFRHPLDSRLYLKRCVALPGDRLFQENKHLYLQIAGDSGETLRFAASHGLTPVRMKGRWWLKDPYASFYPVVHRAEVIGPKELLEYPETAVPPHHFFLMGDFRDDSTDSRFFGPVPYDRIYYRVWYVWKRLRTPGELASAAGKY